MKVAVIGGGPAGLYFSILMKKADSDHDVTVFERNPPDNTFGWGGVFSEQTLGNFAAADPESYDAITDHFARWDDIDIHFRGTTTTSGGHGFVGIARQTRAQVLSIKEKEFVEGARALGAGLFRVMTRHVMPSALTPIVVSITFGIPEAIFTEAALSFIGVGINPPTPSWGQMVGENQQYLRSYWHLCVFPSIAIAVTMLSFTFFGDGVRDALDPKLK